MLSTLKKINALITKRQRKGLLILSLLLFIAMILEIFGLGILIPLLSVILQPEMIDTNPLIFSVRTFFSEFSNQEFVFLFLGFIVILYFLKSVFIVYLSHKQNRFLTGITANISNNLFKSYLSQPYSFHLKKNASDLIKNIQIEINYFHSFIQALITITIEAGFVLSILATLIYIEPFGAICIGIFYGLLSLIFLKFTKKKLNDWGELRQTLDNQVSKIVLDGLGGIKDLMISGKTAFFIDRYSSKNKLKARLNANQATVSVIPRFYFEFISILGLVSFILILLIQERSPTNLISILGVFVAATFRMIPSLNRIIASLQTLKYYLPSVDLIYSEIILQSNNSKILNSNKDFSFQHEINFKKINFKFTEDLYVLKDLNLNIKKGQTIGIIGESGSGKSTLIDLLLGLHEPISGEILIDGSINCQLRQTWRNKIGYVSQSIFLIDDSIKNNIAFGVPENKINEERINRIIKDVRLDKFIQNLAIGLDTKVGERGVQLSGGQRQRIGIARALYNEPEILILDEATSALDTETENEVMDSIYSLKGNITIIMIAHRLSTLSGANIIYELKDNQIYKK